MDIRKILRDYTPNPNKNGNDIVRPVWQHTEVSRNTYPTFQYFFEDVSNSSERS